MALQSNTLLFNKSLPIPNTPNLQTHPLFPPPLFKSPSKKIKFLFAKNRSDSDLALEFAIEAGKLNTQELQKKEAFKKSKSLLFLEITKFMNMEEEDLKKKWLKMNEDDKFVLVKEFVAIWGSNFHPLSARSVKELVDEYLVMEIQDDSDDDPKVFSIFRRLMGFLED